jgi:hypothetical protein
VPGTQKCQQGFIICSFGTTVSNTHDVQTEPNINISSMETRERIWMVTTMNYAIMGLVRQRNTMKNLSMDNWQPH